MSWERTVEMNDQNEGLINQKRTGVERLVKDSAACRVSEL